LALLCAAQFVFWYSLHAFFDTAEWSAAVRRYETWDSINHGNPERRIFGCTPTHPGRCAAIDEARIVWARDLGDAENRQLLRYYADRTALVLEPDAQPPTLAVYGTAAP